jgi:hypothetical protein
MNKPEYVYIMGKKFTVVPYDSSLLPPVDGMIAGHNDPDEQLIHINTRYPPDARADTYLHEILHCIDSNIKIGLTEDQVVSLTSGLLQVVWDSRNKKLFKQLWRL